MRETLSQDMLNRVWARVLGFRYSAADLRWYLRYPKIGSEAAELMLKFVPLRSIYLCIITEECSDGKMRIEAAKRLIDTDAEADIIARAIVALPSSTVQRGLYEKFWRSNPDVNSLCTLMAGTKDKWRRGQIAIRALKEVPTWRVHEWLLSLYRGYCISSVVPKKVYDSIAKLYLQRSEHDSCVLISIMHMCPNLRKTAMARMEKNNCQLFSITNRIPEMRKRAEELRPDYEALCALQEVIRN